VAKLTGAWGWMEKLVEAPVQSWLVVAGTVPLYSSPSAWDDKKLGDGLVDLHGTKAPFTGIATIIPPAPPRTPNSCTTSKTFFLAYTGIIQNDSTRTPQSYLFDHLDLGSCDSEKFPVTRSTDLPLTCSITERFSGPGWFGAD
jgi:hypothetical protein